MIWRREPPLSGFPTQGGQAGGQPKIFLSFNLDSVSAQSYNDNIKIIKK